MTEDGRRSVDPALVARACGAVDRLVDLCRTWPALGAHDRAKQASELLREEPHAMCECGEAALSTLNQMLDRFDDMLGCGPGGPPVERAILLARIALGDVAELRRAAVEAPPRVLELVDDEPAEERRAAPRVLIDAEVDLQSDSQFFTGYSEDLSDGGVFVATYRTLPIGAEVSVELTLPSGRLVWVHGHVAWTREDCEQAPPGLGIAFAPLEPDDRAAIAELLAQRPPLFFPL